MSDETEDTPNTVDTEAEVEIATEPPPASEPVAVAAEFPESPIEPGPEPMKATPVRQAGTSHPRHNKGPAPRLPRD